MAKNAKLSISLVIKAAPLSDSQKDEKYTQNSTSSLQSANRLIVDAIVNMTDIVESMHHRINPLSKKDASDTNTRAGGLTGGVYKSIRSLTQTVGKGMDTPLGVISKFFEKNGVSTGGEALKSALNGVLGDHLVDRNSSLAIPMGLKQDGQPIDVTSLVESIKRSNGKLVIMVHGLCMNDLQWQQEGHDHGKALANDLGHTSVYLRYNTGQHVSENGKAFSTLLEQLVSDIVALDETLQLEMSIVAHSMGGLVSRSAFQQAELLDHKWPEHFENLIFLGTPHHGAPLEKAGSWIDLLLGIHGYTKPLTRLTKIRSAGITDLRHGNILESDWQVRNRFDFSTDKRTPLMLPENVKCYTVATTALANRNKASEHLIGDGLVPLDSALGRHQNKPFTLLFLPENQWIGHDINHMQLLSNPDVYTVIKNWLVVE